MKGKLFVIESGVDASGKATQTEKLYKRLIRDQINVLKITFPDYDSISSSLVKMYLNGDFGERAEDVNPYTASTFYAVDRFASYATKWKSFLEEGGIVIADRYVTSNMVYQASKFRDEEEKTKFLEWLWDLEFVKMGLPVPDEVIFLDMNPEVSYELMKNRANKITGMEDLDIHESDHLYLKKTYENALWVADKYNWYKVGCVENNKLKTIDEIHDEIYDMIKSKV